MARKRKQVNIALIGQGFMGRTHSNAWTQVRRFFDPPVEPVMHTVFGQAEENPEQFAHRWGWDNVTTDWKKLVKSDEIDLVDVVTPNFAHAPVAKAALQAGKPVLCEKPLAGTLADARQMVQAAKRAKVPNVVGFNYRRCPAVALAHELVRGGKIGQVRHVRAWYLQDWADESVPLMWRFDKKLAGSGAHGDLNAHIVDMTRFVTGEEITDICGAIAETFIKERKLMSGVAAGGISEGVKSSARKGKVTVDDTVLFLARFSGGAVASFEAARQATGNKNKNGWEINGTKGSIRFNFERMNELEYFDATGPAAATQGWSTILATEGDHPYAGAWWPPGHVLGYEHGFTHQAYDVLKVLAGQKPTVPLVDFADAFKTQCILEAALKSATGKRPVKVSTVK
ncbi:MAG: Gfo/Idh/MocA family protein [Planctomycetota bacterium]